MNHCLRSVVVGICCCIAIFGNAQSDILLQQAKIEMNNYNKMASSGSLSKSAYESAYKATELYLKAISSSNAESTEYAESRKALRELFPIMSDGAYFYADLGNQEKVLQFACAYIDISLLPAFADAGFQNEFSYPILANLAATNLYNRGQYQKATDYYKAYLTTNSTENREQAFEGLARCFYELKDYGWASYIASQGVQYYPTNWNMLLIGIESYGNTGNDEKMEGLIQKALYLNPGHKGLLEYQGKMYERLKRFDEASSTFDKLYKSNPQSLDYALHLGFNLYNAGTQVLYKSKEPGLNSDESQAMERKAKLNFTKASHALKDVLDNSPYAANVARALAICYSMINDAERLKQVNQSLTAMRINEVATNELPTLDLSYQPMMDLSPVSASGNGTGISSSDSPKSDVDINIPETNRNNNQTYAIIIGNETYKHISKVPYAYNDAKMFAQYCEKVLGIPKDNIRERYDATLSEIREQINYLAKRTEKSPGDLNILFYYSGHGTMDHNDLSSYLLPSDASGTDLEACYSLNKLCEQFEQMPIKKATLFVDACFSGGTRSEEMLIEGARFVTYEPEDVVTKGNTVVFSATSGNQLSLPYDEQGHGFFTYYLLKALQETKGQITYQELADRLAKEVDAKTLDKKNKSQTPSVNASASLGNSWKSFTFLN